MQRIVLASAWLICTGQGQRKRISQFDLHSRDVSHRENLPRVLDTIHMFPDCERWESFAAVNASREHNSLRRQPDALRRLAQLLLSFNTATWLGSSKLGALPPASVASQPAVWDRLNLHGTTMYRGDGEATLTIEKAPAFTPQKHSVSLVALGCPKNTVDAEVMLGDLQRNGLRVVPDPNFADIVIVNTCAFVEEAKRESINAVLEAAQLKEDRKVPVRGLFITGCLAQRYAEELASELPEVDAIVGFEHYADLPRQVLELLEAPLQHQASSESIDSLQKEPTVLVGSASVPFRSEDERVSLTPKHLAYIRVAEGCDHKCTFCAIPRFRGQLRSKPFDVVLTEAQRLVDSGVREINLIAEDTNQYGSDWGEADERRLAHLLYALADIPDLKWIRLLYCYPSYFSEELINAIASIDKVCKYIDIPLQHLSPTVLQRMKRPASKATMELLKKLRARIPNLTLRTTFISGFPGETEEEHRELLEFARELNFERGGAFAYSEEDGTPAADMDGQVEENVKQRRRDELVSLFQDHAMAWADAQVGRELTVMIDGMEGQDAVGRTEADAPDIDYSVRLPDCMLLPGMQVKVRVTAAIADELVAQPIDA